MSTRRNYSGLNNNNYERLENNISFVFNRGGIHQQGPTAQVFAIVDGVRMTMDGYSQWMRSNPPPPGVWNHYPNQNFILTNDGIVDIEVINPQQGFTQTGGNPQTEVSYRINGAILDSNQFSTFISNVQDDLSVSNSNVEISDFVKGLFANSSFPYPMNNEQREEALIDVMKNAEYVKNLIGEDGLREVFNSPDLAKFGFDKNAFPTDTSSVTLLANILQDSIEHGEFTENQAKEHLANGNWGEILSTYYNEEVLPELLSTGADNGGVAGAVELGNLNLQELDLSNYSTPHSNEIINDFVEDKSMEEVETAASGMDLILKDQVSYLTSLTESPEGRDVLKILDIDVDHLTEEELTGKISELASDQVHSAISDNPIVVAQSSLVIGNELESSGMSREEYVNSGSVQTIINNVHAGSHVINEGLSQALGVENKDQVVGAILSDDGRIEERLHIDENLDSADLGEIYNGAGVWVSDSRFAEDNTSNVIGYIKENTEDAVNIAQGTSFAVSVFGYEATNETVQSALVTGTADNVMELARGLDAYNEHLVSTGMTQEEAVAFAQEYVAANEDWQSDLEEWMKNNEDSSNGNSGGD